MKRLFQCIVVVSSFLSLLTPQMAAAQCSRFTASTMDIGGGPKASWRTDYPAAPGDMQTPWTQANFRTAPEDYMAKVLQTVRPHFTRSGDRLVGTDNEPWWMAPWMDFSTSGREPRMGLTRERGPDPKDLSPTSMDGFQVWAVGFYNPPGAAALGEVFADFCDPSVPVQMRFPIDTVSVKFLFTDAPPEQVSYLEGAPTYKALIDPHNAGPNTGPENRVPSDVRLLQVDIAVKDRRARETAWVFGTFAWVGPATGDMLFDNLVPVSLQWGNDPGVYDTQIKQSWINPALQGKLYGWPERPTLGFNGRANGPADNIRSSCLSCHSTARTPRSSKGILGAGFNMTDLSNPARVKSHVDLWFANLTSSQLFTPDEPAVATLDYSLQLEAGLFRMCMACRVGDMHGATPQICRRSGFYNKPSCATPQPGPVSTTVGGPSAAGLTAAEPPEIRALRVLPPARQ
jgi:hypothetical protein